MDPKNLDFKKMMSAMMENAQKLQKEMAATQEGKTVEGQAGGGMVKVTADLKMQILGMNLTPELFQETPEVISELIVAGVNQALKLAKKEAQSDMMSLTKKMGMPDSVPSE